MSPPTTAKQRKEVQDVLKQPLADQQVMVPMTTKAFFSGTLRPSIDSSGEEQVLMNLGKGYHVEMTRSEAIQHLGDTSKTKAKAEALMPASSQKQAGEKVEANKDAPSLPYFEIREEYDASGNEIHAEAVNVVKELEYLQKKEKNSEETTASISAASSASLQPPTQETNNVEESTHETSDQQYASLSARLDELARLEEEAERNERINKKSAKQLQSKGWAKGFLSKDTTKKKKQASSKAVAQDKPMQTAMDVATGPAVTERPQDEKKVGFQATNEVREIPRVGQRSAAELKPKPVVENTRKQLEGEVFSGVVKERPMERQPAAQRPAQTPQRKKLSRFAQERMQQQQQR